MLRLLALALFAAPALAQPLRFEWKAGEVHKFTVLHETTVIETTADKITSTTSSKLKLSKFWTVVSVDADGATLSLTVTAMRQDLTRPVVGDNGKIADETSTVDSATPDGAKQMAAYLNTPLLTAKIDARGRISDVKAVFPDAALRLQEELPFRILLPDEALTADSKWERPFTIKLDPPAGTGEVHEAVQSFAVEKLDAARTVFKVGTSMKSPPKEVADLQPLLPWLWEGTVTIAGGRYQGSKLAVSRDYPNHAGAGSKFSFRSTLSESRE